MKKKRRSSYEETKKEKIREKKNGTGVQRGKKKKN